MEISQSQKTALVFGASGLIGSSLVKVLLDHPAYAQVKTFGRRTQETSHPKHEHFQIDFEKLDSADRLFAGEDVFSCMGTTMAKAGSREAFYRVDFTYAFETAKRSLEHGARQLMLVSAVGAAEDSLFYYSRVKAELEAAVSELPYWSVHLFRPSVLDGDRREFRFGEALSARLLRGADFLTGGQLLGRFKPIEDHVVARAMVAAAQGLEPGKHIYENVDIFKQAERIPALPFKSKQA